MSDRYRVTAVGVNTIVFAWLLAGCGDYSNDKKDATGGASGTATGGASGTATGGASGAATGGASGSSSGQSGSGGSGAPTGGASGTGGSGAGTGGGGGKASCTDAAPCGGDAVGTWTSAACSLTVGGMADVGPAGIGCTLAPITGSLSVSGTWTAMAGGMYTDDTTTTGQVVVELEAACLMVSGFATTCDRVVLDTLGLPSPEPPATACVDNAATGGCTCTATINQHGGLGLIAIDAPTSGTYTTLDNKVVTSSAGVDTEYSYCVAGNTLTMKLNTAKVGTVTGPIVFQK